MLNLEAIQQLHALTLGDPKVRVAVLDGVVDQGHDCFEGASLTRLSSLVEGDVDTSGAMSAHGTHVASVIFGQPESSVVGIAPQCEGMIIPVFGDERCSASQLDLARGIEQAVNAGAHIINVSGGELTDFGEAEAWLENAVRLCQARNVLIVAAVGNDGCDCLHVPAALPTVLAVGAMDADGKPIDFSNWGQAYRTQGILAPGVKVLGAKPGGGTHQLNGTSFATPVVTGVAALLLSLQAQQGESLDPQRVREVLLQSALPCDLAGTDAAEKCLLGSLNVPGAVTLIKGGAVTDQGGAVTEPSTSPMAGVQPADCGCGGTIAPATPAPEDTEHQVSEAPDTLRLNFPEVSPAGAVPAEAAGHPEDNRADPDSTSVSTAAIAGAVQPAEAGAGPPESQPAEASAVAPAISVADSTVNPVHGETTQMPETPSTTETALGVTASQAPNEIAQEGQLVYALGTLGYDFGSEARRDSFKQLMPAADIAGTLVPANPYDARQMVDYLETDLSEARSLIWTLNIELTPVYAIEPKGPFAREVYQVLQELLSGQIQAEDSTEYVERVSIPGLLTGRTVKLFSGQVVPVIEPQNTRGLYGWTVNTLVNAAMTTVRETEGDVSDDAVRRTLTSFLNRIYYDLRNLGTTSQDRALNFAVTNAFQAASTFSQAVAQGMELDTVTVEKSPFCRMDSDCWDVKLKFFDPENSRRARKIYRFTIDVSDLIPVTLGEVKSWSSAF